MKVMLVWSGPQDAAERAPLERRQIPLLAGLAAQGVSTVVVLCGDRGGLGPCLTRAGLSVEHLTSALTPSPLSAARVPAAALAVRALVRRHEPDLLEGDEPFPAIAAGLAGTGRAQVVAYRRHHYHGRTRLLLASRLAAHLADCTMVSCEALRRRAADEDHVPMRRIEVTTSGMPEPLVPAAGAVDRARTSLGLPREARVIVCVSRLRREKGLDLLIAALPQVAVAGGGVHLVIVGAGPEDGALRAQAAAAGAAVHFTGHQDDVTPWLALGDVVAIPSRRESFGRVTLEAMALGRPIVAARVGGLPEAIVDRESGWLVPANDVAGLAIALRTLLDDPTLAARLGDAARLRHRACYGIDQMATSWRHGWERALTYRRRA